jgi:pimeloyl-ACP methyl ester carboxylesterase
LYQPIAAEYFCTLIPNAKSILFEECGHFMAIDKPEEVAKSITTFYNEQYKKERSIT